MSASPPLPRAARGRVPGWRGGQLNPARAIASFHGTERIGLSPEAFGCRTRFEAEGDGG